MEEKTYTFNEIAKLLGVTEAEVIQRAKESGLLDSNGMPTEFALSEDLLCTEEIDTGFGLN